MKDSFDLLRHAKSFKTIETMVAFMHHTDGAFSLSSNQINIELHCMMKYNERGKNISIEHLPRFVFFVSASMISFLGKLITFFKQQI